MFVGQECMSSHVGDSRCYLLHRGVFKQLTRDHTMANQMAEQGNLPRHNIESSPWSNVLWNALGGGGRDVVADVERSISSRVMCY